MGGLVDRVRISVLGPLEVRRDGELIDIGGPKSRAVLVVLAHHLDEIVSTDVLIDALWAGRPPKSARNVIQVRISHLRRDLGPGCEIRTESSGYVLESSGVEVDADEFEALVLRGERLLADDPAAAEEASNAALECWRGDLAAMSLELDSTRVQVEALRDLRVRAQALRIDALLATGQHRDCCADAAALADDHPFREDLRARHLVALYRSGRQTEALAAFRRTRELLVEELGIEPGPELRELHRRILEHDPVLDPRGPSAPRSTLENTLSPSDTLRPEPNAFVDRPEIATVATQLRPGRVVTVVGTGGIGKSRCVATVARLCASDAVARDGVWIVDLATLPDGSDEVASAVASTMRLGSEPGESVTSAITRYLAHRTTLLVLDNCEHVVESARRFAVAMSDDAPSTAVLAASRVRLGLASESVVTLDRLPDAAAQELLIARIGEVGAGPFSNDECAELCNALDNYPLALELAAARTRAMAPREIVARLVDQPELLKSQTSRSTSGRSHVGVGAALDWSLAQLSGRARATLDRATVFVHHFDLATAEAVLSTDGVEPNEVVEDLGELVEHHLVSRDHGLSRFRLLEPIRQHLRANAPDVSLSSYIEHFARFGVDAAIGLRGPDEARWWDRYALELPHLREVVRLLIERGDVAQLDPLMAEMAISTTICAFAEPGEWAVDALDRLALTPSEAPGVTAAVAAQYCQIGMVEACEALLTELDAALDDPWWRAVTAAIRTFIHPGDTRWYAALIEAAEQCDEPALVALGKVLLFTPDMVEVVDDYGNPTLRVYARLFLSASYQDSLTDIARQNRLELHRIALESNNMHTIAEGQMFMALQFCHDQEPVRAAPHAVEMIELMVRVRSPQWVWQGVEVIAIMLAMVRMHPYTSEMLWSAVDTFPTPPSARQKRRPHLPEWVASQLSDDERRRAIAEGAALDMDAAVRIARKAAESMAAS